MCSNPRPNVTLKRVSTNDQMIPFNVVPPYRSWQIYGMALTKKCHGIYLPTYYALHIKSVLKFQTIPKTLGIHSVNDVMALRNDDVIDFQNENLAIILSKSVHVHNQ